MDPSEKIYGAALKLYYQFGLQKANIQEIADLAGVSKKTIYNHFNGKEELFHRTIQWHVQYLVKFYDELIHDHSLEIPAKLIKAVEFASREMSYKHSLIYNDMKRPNPYLKQTPLGYIRSNVRTAICSLIDEAKKDGICRKDYSTEKLSYVIFSVINGLLSWEDSENLQIGMSELFDATITLIFDSLLTEKGRSLLPVDDMAHRALVDS